MKDFDKFVPDMDTVLKQADRTAAEQKRRRALEAAPASSGPASVPADDPSRKRRPAAQPRPTKSRVAASRQGMRAWQKSVLAGLAVVLPVAVFVIAWEKAHPRASLAPDPSAPRPTPTSPAVVEQPAGPADTATVRPAAPVTPTSEPDSSASSAGVTAPPPSVTATAAPMQPGATTEPLDPTPATRPTTSSSASTTPSSTTRPSKQAPKQGPNLPFI